MCILCRPEKGPLKLYIGSLHVNITEDMLRGIFEPFGRIQTIQLVKARITNINDNLFPTFL